MNILSDIIVNIYFRNFFEFLCNISWIIFYNKIFSCGQFYVTRTLLPKIHCKYILLFFILTFFSLFQYWYFFNINIYCDTFFSQVSQHLFYIYFNNFRKLSQKIWHKLIQIWINNLWDIIVAILKILLLNLIRKENFGISIVSNLAKYMISSQSHNHKLYLWKF